MQIYQEADGKLKEKILAQIPTPVVAVNKDFKIIYMNEAGISSFANLGKNYIGRSCKEVLNTKHCSNGECCMKETMKKGIISSSRNVANINGKKVQIEYFCVPLKDEEDEIIGGLEFIVDITEQVLYEERLIEQSHTIREMSTPTIKLWEGVMLLPIVGIIDSMRAQHMMENMLNKIAETFAKVIILDIHGVAAIDTAVANHLIKITRATKLMGCECILSGISPTVAQTIIRLGIDMDNMMTKATLKDALLEAFSILGLEVLKPD